jgi:hypothetical protein
MIHKRPVKINVHPNFHEILRIRSIMKGYKSLYDFTGDIAKKEKDRHREDDFFGF